MAKPPTQLLKKTIADPLGEPTWFMIKKMHIDGEVNPKMTILISRLK